MTEVMLSTEDLSAGYQGVPALENVSMEINEHEVVAMIGPNGAGKTTFIHTVMGLVKATSGKVTYKGEDITGMRTWDIARRGIALVPAGRRIFPKMDVLENLQLGAYTLKSREQTHERIKYVFNLFPILEERKNQRAGTMSGGQQQMVAIGRALMLNPKLLILDEPSIGLAPLIVDQMYAAIEKLVPEGLTILVVEQNITKALEIAQRGYVLQRGKIAMKATSKELAESPDLISTYLTSA